MEKNALPPADKIAKLARNSMPEKPPIKSEGQHLDAFLEELQKEHDVKEISGWETGFPNLSRALDGILPGLYLLVGPPARGKTSLAKQLLDQVVTHNSVPGIFFSFAERKEEIRIKTLARLSGLESREIRRGSAYLLHWYGVPKARYSEPDQLPPSWEKLKRASEEARPWLDLIYLVECGRETSLPQVESYIQEVKSGKKAARVLAVIDDCHRLGDAEQPLRDRLALVAEQLHAMAVNLDVPILSVWPDLAEEPATPPQAYA
jgi:replicative DNA helicase